MRTGSPAYQSIVMRGLGLKKMRKSSGSSTLVPKPGRRSRSRTPITLTLLANGVRMASRSVDMQCWKCGAELKNLLLPFSRYEECSKCRADLHACLGCRHYDPAADACREDRADFTLDKDKANFCDFFTVHTKAYNPRHRRRPKSPGGTC